MLYIFIWFLLISYLGVGIADESVQYARDDNPEAKGIY